jgi:hypothetical protein
VRQQLLLEDLAGVVDTLAAHQADGAAALADVVQSQLLQGRTAQSCSVPGQHLAQLQANMLLLPLLLLASWLCRRP